MLTANDLADRLDLDRCKRSWRGTCPACDYARAFSMKAGKSLQPLVYCTNGCSKADLADALARRFGDCWKRPAPPQRDAENETALRERKIGDALRIWNGSAAATGTAADLYLTGRGLHNLAGSTALRFRPDCGHPEERALSPALIGLVVDVSTKPVAVHRTFITRDGRKAAVEPQKASKGPTWGAAIRLDPAAPELVIGEGIETAASAGRLINLPAWAAISAGNLARALVLPPDVRAVVIAADPDPPGEKAACEAAARWQAEGRRVRIARPTGNGDFNDLLRERMGVARAE